MFALRKPTLQWLSLVGIIWLQSINGTNTNFPAYSSHLKASLSLSQLQLNNLAFASDAGKLFGNLAGVAAMILPFPAVLAGGSALGLVGYGLQYLSVAGHAPPLAYWQVFALTAVAGNSICWINTVSYAVIIGNFPAGLRQTAVGLATSYQGLSAKLYSDAARFLAGKPDRSYLLLNSVSPMAVSLATAPFVRIVNVGEGFKEARMESGFLVMFVITVMTGIYSVATSLGALGLHSSVSAIGTAVLMAAPISVPAGRAVWSNRRKVHSLTEESDGAVKVDGGGDAEVEGSGVIMEEVGAWGMVRRVDFWLYFWAYFGSVTVGLVYLNNLGQIADSRGCAATSSIVSLSSSFGFFGRLMPSLLDYHFSRSKHVISRPGMIAILAAPMAGAFFILLIPTDHALQVGTAIIGVCTGAITSISVSTTSELFGTRNFSVNHNVLVANIPIGSFLFGYLAAVFYNRERNEFADHNGNCMGMECYRISFVVWGCVSLIGTFLAFVLYVRTKKFYSQPREGQAITESKTVGSSLRGLGSSLLNLFL